MFPEEAETRKRSAVDMAERITQESGVGADYCGLRDVWQADETETVGNTLWPKPSSTLSLRAS
jgi:hypothetical protein